MIIPLVMEENKAFRKADVLELGKTYMNVRGDHSYRTARESSW